jgi:hypothetical protein
MPSFVVEFWDCDEAVIRSGESAESASYPDDLGCPVRCVRPLSEVRLRSEPWTKGGELRCEVVE